MYQMLDLGKKVWSAERTRNANNSKDSAKYLDVLLCIPSAILSLLHAVHIDMEEWNIRASSHLSTLTQYSSSSLHPSYQKCMQHLLQLLSVWRPSMARVLSALICVRPCWQERRCGKYRIVFQFISTANLILQFMDTISRRNIIPIIAHWCLAGQSI